MLLFFSVKGAIVLAAIGMLIGLFGRPATWFTQILDMISLGFGTMMQRKWLHAILLIVISHYWLKITLYFLSDMLEESFLTMVLYAVIFIYTILVADLAVEERESELNEESFRRFKEEAERLLQEVKIRDAALLGAPVASSSYSNSGTGGDETNYGYSAEHQGYSSSESSYSYSADDEIYEDDEDEAYSFSSSYDDDTDEIFEQMEEDRRFEEIIRTNRELDELTSFGEDSIEFGYHSMDELDDFTDDMDDFQDMHDDFNDMNDDFHHSHDDYNTYDHHEF